MVKCREVMTENPVCCLTDDSVERIAQWMQTEDIGAIPVVDNYQSRRLIGIVTDRDLALRVMGLRRDAKDTMVGDVMTSRPVACTPSDDLETVMDVMSHHQIRRIPVVDTDGQLVGIISQADLATRLRDPHKAADVLQEVSQPNPVAVQS
jgi:CBS domain-containing protein